MKRFVAPTPPDRTTLVASRAVVSVAPEAQGGTANGVDIEINKAKTKQETAKENAALRSALSWGLCVATLDRIDTLSTCVDYALVQTRKPAEIVIVDASEDWEAHRDRILAQAAPFGVPVIYLRAARRSSAAQRNQGVRAASADILFMIDDDTFMYPDCAARIMAAYEADSAGRLGAIACAQAAQMPGESRASGIARKDNSAQRDARLNSLLRRSRRARFFWRRVLLMSSAGIFVRYDGPRPVFREDLVAEVGLPGCIPVAHISGFSMTVRRELVLREPFEEALLAYSPSEDIEVTYRFTRHAANARLRDALVYHHQAAAGRIKRRQVTELTMSNIAFYIRKRSSNLRRDVTRYYILALRLIVAETLKDGLSLRLTFPQLRGALAGIVRSPAIFRTDPAVLEDRYQTIQQNILAKKPRPAKG